MKHLKLFESYSKPQFRIPEEVNKEEWGNKYVTHGYSPFTEKEKEFFVQFSKSDSYYLNLDNIHSELRPSLNITNTNSDGEYTGRFEDYFNIEILKLEDEWYLISKYKSLEGNKYYICDQWEEVLGYLSSEGFNI
jgi:hypothetical protein